MFVRYPLIMNKQLLIYTVFAFLFTVELCAQSPPHINYQAVLRNTQAGEERSNKEVFIVSKFISGGPDGEIVYQEEHKEVTTSRLGLINLQLGDGYAVQGNFSSIPWVNGDIWLSIEIDAGNGLKPLAQLSFPAFLMRCMRQADLKLNQIWTMIQPTKFKSSIFPTTH